MAAIATKSARKSQKSTKSAKLVKATTKTTAAKAAPAKSATNPYRAGGSYAAVVDGLRALGVGKMHSQADVIKAVRKAMGANWGAFAKKDNRNDNGKNADGRVWQNCSVVARADYGLPLVKLGFVVKFDGRAKECGLFKNGK